MAETIQLGSPGVEIIVDEAYLVSDVGTAGSLVTDRWEFMLQKNGVTNMLAAPVTTDVTEITANQEYVIGPVLAAQRRVLATDTLQIVVTETGAPTDLSGANIAFGTHENVARG